MSKHTPGPWTINDCTRRGTGRYRWRITVGEGRDAEPLIAEIPSEYPADDTTNEANARLIVAAPELLAALKDALREIHNPGAERNVLQTIDAAITKAEGAQS